MVSAIERERKFLLQDKAILDGHTPTPITQVYLVNEPEVELRIRKAGESFLLTAKMGDASLSRLEDEVILDSSVVGQSLLDSAPGGRIIKKRYALIIDEFSAWDIDVFEGENDPLILAEIELDDTSRAVRLPEWVGEEVTGNPRFYNSQLAREPVQSWPSETREYYGLA